MDEDPASNRRLSIHLLIWGSHDSTVGPSFYRLVVLDVSALDVFRALVCSATFATAL